MRATSIPPGIPNAAPVSIGREISRPASARLIPYSSMASGSKGETAKRLSPAARWAARAIAAMKRRDRPSAARSRPGGLPAWLPGGLAGALPGGSDEIVVMGWAAPRRGGQSRDVPPLRAWTVRRKSGRSERPSIEQSGAVWRDGAVRRFVSPADTGRALVAHRIDVAGDSVRVHELRRRWYQEGRQRLRVLGQRVQPQSLRFLGKDDRHAVVDRLYQAVGCGGDNGAGAKIFPLRDFQVSHKPAKAMGSPDFRKMY